MVKAQFSSAPKRMDSLQLAEKLDFSAAPRPTRNASPNFLLHKTTCIYPLGVLI